VISLALRLAVRGGREAAARAVFIAVGVALGVVLMVTAFASYHALRAEDAHSGWLSTAAHNRSPSVNEATTDPLGWRKTTDEFNGLPIVRIDVAATGSRSPRPPGIPALPSPGQFYASPALARLLAATPADQLGNRYPGHQVGTIGRTALATPNVLVIVIGRSPEQLATEPGAVSVRSIEAAPTRHSYTTFQEVALGIGAAGLLFPILTFVAMATRIAAARREQRLAAMRLVGATVRQIAWIAAVEAAIAAFVGAVAGVGSFFVLRPEIARLKVTGDRWFTGALSPGAPAVGIVCIAVPIAAGLAAIASLRRVSVSPLGVSRRVTPPPPTRRRLIPLGLGLFILAIFALAGRTYSRGASGSYAPTIVAGFVLTLAGIIVAGPWLTMAATTLLATRSTRAPSLIASRRLADNPAAAFRAVSGLILAVFVGSVFAAGTATASNPTALGDDPGAATTAIARPTGPPLSSTSATSLAAQLRSVVGVRGVTLVRTFAGAEINGYPQGLLVCDDLSATPEIGRCESRTGVAIMPLYSLDAGHTEPHTRWPAPATGAADPATSSVAAVVIATDSSDATLERVRTTIQATAPDQLTVPRTVGQTSAATLRDVTQLQHLADLAVLLSVVIAGCSLAVAVAGSLIERRRPFALLRLTGMPLRSLRRVVLLEAAVPLVGLAVVSAAGGLLTAELLLRALRGTTMRLPGTPYPLTLLAGIVLALTVVMATMPLLRRISSPENARSE
jgi:hypothetical protein